MYFLLFCEADETYAERRAPHRPAHLDLVRAAFGFAPPEMATQSLGSFVQSRLWREEDYDAACRELRYNPAYAGEIRVPLYVGPQDQDVLAQTAPALASEGGHESDLWQDLIWPALNFALLVGVLIPGAIMVGLFLLYIVAHTQIRPDHGPPVPEEDSREVRHRAGRPRSCP